MSGNPIKEPHRRVSKRFYCPFCGKRENKLIPVEQAEQFESMIGSRVRDAEGRMPIQCWDCQMEEKAKK